MTDFFKGQMDYIYFFYGLAFLMISAAGFLMTMRKNERLPWLWFALFAATHTVHEWMDFVKINFGEHPVLEIIAVFFGVVSFLFLAEFGRAGLARLRGKGTGRWVFVPLVLIAVAGLAGGPEGAEASCRSVVGLVGGLWAGYALLLASRETEGAPRRWLAICGGTLWLYALAAVFGPPAGFFPPSHINNEAFLETLGFPVQLLRGALATLAATSLWAYSQSTPNGETVFNIPRYRHFFRPVPVLLSIILLGWVMTQFAGNQAKKEDLREGRLFIGALAENIDHVLKDVRRAARRGAESPTLASALLTGRPSDLNRAGAALRECSNVMSSASATCYLLDSGGRPALSSLGRTQPDLPSMGAAGMNEKTLMDADDHYFFDLKAGQWNYIARYPVRDARGRTAGFIVARENLADLEKAFSKHPRCFLVNPDGIIFLSSSEEMRLRSLLPLKSSEKQRLVRSGLLGPASFKPLLSGKATEGEYVFMDGRQFLVSRSFVGDGWSLLLLNGTGHIRAYRLFAIFTTLAFFVLTIVFFAALYFFRNTTAQIAFSERRYRSLVEGSPNCVILFDEGGRCLAVNKAGLESIGCSQGDIKGKRPDRFWTENASRAFDSAIEDALQGNRHFFEVSGVCPAAEGSGELKVWNAVINPVIDISGDVRNFVGIFTDVTDQKKAEKELRRAHDELEDRVRERTSELLDANERLQREMTERLKADAALKDSEERFRSLFNFASDSIILLDPSRDGHPVIVDVNVRALSAHGYTREEMVGKPISLLDPDENSEEVRVKAGQVKSGETLTYEAEHLRKDGTAFPVEVSATLIHINGKPYILSTDRDITERKKAEEALAAAFMRAEEERAKSEAIVAALGDGISMQSRDFKVLYQNQIHKDLVGECSGQYCYEAYAGVSSVCLGCPVALSFDDGKVHTLEKALRKGEETTYIEIKASPLKDMSGKVVAGIELVRDVTERKRAEELVRESEERYKNLVELTTDIIYIADRDGNQTYMNDAAYKILGFDPADVIGKPWTMLVHPDDREKSHRKFLDMIEQGFEVFNFESRQVTKNGKILNMFHNIRILRNERGEIIGTQGIARDITERKQAEERLRLFSEAMEEAMDGVQIIDLTGRIIYSNRAIEDIYGFTRAELMGVRVGELNADKDFDRTVILPSIRETGRWNGELNVIHKSGREFPIWLSASLVKNSAGRPISMVGIIRDITELKKVEEELKEHREHLMDMVEERTSELKTAVQLLTQEIAFRKTAEETLRESEHRYRNLSQEFHTLLDAIPDSLLLLSPDLEVLWANDGAAKAFGKEVAELTGQHCYKLWHNSSTVCDDCHAMKSFLTGCPEGSRRTAVGSRLLDSRAFPIRGDDGKVSNVILIVTDVTEKATLEAEAMRAGHLASLGELAAGVAHEINNPINGIINYAQIFANVSKPGSREAEIAGRIMKEGDRIAGIVRSLLSFARERKEEKMASSLQVILFESLTLSEAQFRKDGIELKMDFPADLAEITANPQQIQQVFLNIISNARYALNQKYPAADRNKILEISGENITVDNEAYVRFAFLDYGPGIPANTLDKVMNPFFSTKPSGQGTGLGLSISHGLVKDHGGKLIIESSEGEYTRIVIDLPAGGTSGKKS
jgi:PAS domain S-box-containing protein